MRLVVSNRRRQPRKGGDFHDVLPETQRQDKTSHSTGKIVRRKGNCYAEGKRTPWLLEKRRVVRRGRSGSR